MKRILALTLIVAAALTLASCKKDEKITADTSTQTYPVQTAEVIKPEELTDKALVRGTINDYVYHNEFSGLTFNFSDLWDVSDDESLASSSGCEVEDMAQDKIPTTIASREKTYDFSAYNELLDVEVNIYFENMLSYSNEIMDDSEYAEAFMSRLPGGENAATSVSENTTVMLGGQEYHKVVCSVSIMGIVSNQAHYFRTVDGVVCGISMVFSSTDVLPQVEEMSS